MNRLRGTWTVLIGPNGVWVAHNNWSVSIYYFRYFGFEYMYAVDNVPTKRVLFRKIEDIRLAIVRKVGKLNEMLRMHR
jgi:hypothetical protein